MIANANLRVHPSLRAARRRGLARRRSNRDTLTTVKITTVSNGVRIPVICTYKYLNVSTTFRYCICIRLGIHKKIVRARASIRVRNSRCAPESRLYRARESRGGRARTERVCCLVALRHDDGFG